MMEVLFVLLSLPQSCPTIYSTEKMVSLCREMKALTRLDFGLGLGKFFLLSYVAYS